MKKALYMNGKWTDASEYAALHSPYQEEFLANIPVATSEQVEEAIQFAINAEQSMRDLTSLEKSKILLQICAQFEDRKEEAAKIIATETAKPMKFALGEIERTIETYRFAAEEAKRLTGELIPMDAAKNGFNKLAYTLYEPIGTVAAITPFNFPQNLVAHKVGPAIAAGNPVILKPASQTPLSALFLAELIHNTDLPKGAFQVITGGGSQIGDHLVLHNAVKMITFTGSPGVGKSIKNKAGLKRVSLELGSNAGCIIDNGVDISAIAKKCVVGAFSNQGQVCISLQRIYIMEDSYKAFIDELIKEVKSLKIGNPLLLDTDISAMINKKETVRAKAWIDEAVNLGATIEYGGEIINDMLQPTVLANVPSHAKISCQEAFAPVVLINKISSVEEGISEINHSIYGLQAGIFTNNITTAFHASKCLHVGGVIINDIPTFRVDQMPYGGVKDSGTGREGIKYALEEMTEMKLVVWNEG
ncbi:aldehyde dehydrogenase family protein [Solibacillus silvestris]|uniref:aldehyde dehydrogenase family protein n=1 Tax=Solibacillus silvestris TaxID=76853 RepID=UPI003F7E5027